MGIPDDEAAAADDEGEGEGDDDDDRFPVWPANERALTAFLICRRQWLIGAMGGFVGLNYPGCESLLRMSKIKVDADLIDDLAAIEGGALEVLNAKR